MQFLSRQLACFGPIPGTVTLHFEQYFDSL